MHRALLLGMKAIQQMLQARGQLLGALLMGGIWFNKALNAMVVLARTNSGLEKLPDTTAVRQITGTGACHPGCAMRRAVAAA